MKAKGRDTTHSRRPARTGTGPVDSRLASARSEVRRLRRVVADLTIETLILRERLRACGCTE